LENISAKKVTHAEIIAKSSIKNPFLLIRKTHKKQAKTIPIAMKRPYMGIGFPNIHMYGNNFVQLPFK
jgi:hypothetical protein